MALKRQIPALVLPSPYVLTTDVETLNDVVAHNGLAMPISYIREKMIHIIATEVVAAGIIGNLQCWIELSPWGTAGTWGVLGVPLIEIATGVNATVHNILLPWNVYQRFGRVVCQVPVAGTPLTDFWQVQAWIVGQG